MTEFQLADFLNKFLASQGLKDFRLTFEPTARAGHRAKRSDTIVKATKPSRKDFLADEIKVVDLFKELYKLSDDLDDWVNSPKVRADRGVKRYRPFLVDDQGIQMSGEMSLGELRARIEARDERDESRSRKDLLMVIAHCDRRMDPAKVTKLLSEIARERRGS